MMKTTLRAVAAATGFFALALQYWLEVHLPRAPSVFVSTINFLSYFTILANTAAALAMLVPLVAPNSSVARFLSKPSVRTAIAAYLIVVAITYYAFLRFIGDDYGLERIADRLMHYVTPLLFLIDWLAFVPKGRLPWTVVATSLLLPLAYAVWVIVHGVIANWYPYPFVDIRSLGYQQGLQNMAGFLIVFVAITLTLLAIGRIVGSVQRSQT
jgi:hypothetical protein